MAFAVRGDIDLPVGVDLPGGVDLPDEIPLPGDDAATADAATADGGPAEAGPADESSALGGLRPALTPQDARTALAALPETEAAPAGLPDYERDDYGERWADVDGNGCNQRDDVLLRDAQPETVRTAPQNACGSDVLAGTWLDPYTGVTVTFDDLKDEAQAQAISIDHVVPLAEAHRSGAAGWQPQQRVEFANDLDNLLAVDGPTNSIKGDADPSRWLPPDSSSWCGYAVVWVSVKTEWSLSVDAEERAAVERVLADC